MDGRDHDLGQDELLEELQALIRRADPVPEVLNEAARAAYTWRTVDAELAQLMHDTAIEDEAALLVRGPRSPRILSFEARRLAIEVEVICTGRRCRRLVGQLAPGAAATVEVDHAGGIAAIDADELGRFCIDGVRAGPARLRCRLAAPPRETVTTEWAQV